MNKLAFLVIFAICLLSQVHESTAQEQGDAGTFAREARSTGGSTDVLADGQYYVTVNPYHADLVLDTYGKSCGDYRCPRVNGDVEAKDKWTFTAYVVDSITYYTIVIYSQVLISALNDYNSPYMSPIYSPLSPPYIGAYELWEVVYVGTNGLYQLKTNRALDQPVLCLDADVRSIVLNDWPSPFFAACNESKISQQWRISETLTVGCEQGYTNFTNSGCTGDIANCAVNTCPKDGSATCIPALVGYDCVCNAGYRGDGRTCVDINECAAGTYTCLSDGTAHCSNKPGGYECVCNAGLVGDAKTHCVDINECAAGTHTCLRDGTATCINTFGGYDCVCNAGGTGDGRTSCVGPTGIFEGDYFVSANPYHADLVVDANGYTCYEHTCTILRGQDVTQHFYISPVKLGSSTYYTIATYFYGWSCDHGDGQQKLFMAGLPYRYYPYYYSYHLWEIAPVGTTGFYQFKSTSQLKQPIICLDADYRAVGDGAPTPFFANCDASKISQQWRISSTLKVGCEQGYTNLTDNGCTIAPIDECAAHTDNCLRDGTATCTDAKEGFTCACKAGFKGDGIKSCVARLFFIKNKLSNLVLEAGGLGANVVTAVQKATNFRNQLWSFDGMVLQNNGTGHVMDIKNYNLALGAEIITWTRKYPTVQNQNFYYLDDVFFSSAIYLALDIKGGSTSPNTPIILWDRKSTATNSNQRFTMIEYVN